MELITDIEFLRRDNTHLYNEVQSLRQQSDLLRQRSEELEKRLHEHAGANTFGKDIPEGKKRVVSQSEGDPILFFDTKTLSEPQVIIRSTEFQSPHISIAWDESPVERVTPAIPRASRHLSTFHTSVHSGPHLIGEAPAYVNVNSNKLLSEKNQSHDHPITNSLPPSPDSEPQQRSIRIPSLRSVVPPVSGVALPNVALALLELRLIKKEAYDSPAAVASFMQKLTHHIHIPRSTYRAAFTDAFTYIIPLLGPIGSLSHEWLTFLHDFPSRIPASHRDSFVSIVWPDQAPIPKPGLAPFRQRGDATATATASLAAASDSQMENITDPFPLKRFLHPKRRSRSMDAPVRLAQPPVLPPIVTDSARMARVKTSGPGVPKQGPSNASTPVVDHVGKSGSTRDNRNININRKSPEPSFRKKDGSTTHSPACERDAWVLLLALAYAAFPDSKMAKRMRKLPVVIRMQMIAWMPPGISVYANMEFASTTVDDALIQLWDSKKEILRLTNGWK